MDTIQTASRPGAVPLSELQTDCAACDGHGMIIHARIVHVLASYTSDPFSPDNCDALCTCFSSLSVSVSLSHQPW